MKHPNPSVKVEACKILTQLCTTPTTFITLATLDPIPSLLPLLSSPPPLQKAALTLLLHLSTSDPLLPLLLSHPTISTLIELLRSSPPPTTIAPTLSILTNLSRTETGASLLLQAGTHLEGLHLRRLLLLFLLPPSHPPADPYERVASLLLNVSQLPSGRHFLLSPSTTALSSLTPYVLSPNPTRQSGVLTMFRNLFLDPSSHPLLLSPTLPLLPSLLLLIAGPGDVRPDERPGFFPDVLSAMDPSHPRHPDPAIRRLVLECIVLAARERVGRAYMKERGVYPVLRELHQVHEKGEQGDAGLDEMLYEVVPYFILPEDEEEMRKDRERRPHVEERKGVEGVEERKEETKGPALPAVGGERGVEEDADEKTAALLDELSLASKAVLGDVQQRRAEREKVDRAAREHREEVQRQMESRERVDATVEGEEEGEEDVEDDDLPDLIEEAAAADAINEMD